MAAPAATLQKVRYRLIDLAATNPLMVDATTLQASVDMALDKYSRDRPVEVDEDQVGDGTGYMVIVGTGAVLADWVDGFSSMLRVEYPASAVAAGYTPTYLEEGQDFEVGYRAGGKQYVRFITVKPSATETVRFTYTTRPIHTTSSNTVPAADLEALCDLSAHYACKQLATKMAASSNPQIAADSVNYRDGQLRFKQQADEWMRSYNDRMGIADDASGSGSVAGASVRADWDQALQNGLPFLTHWGRRR